MTTSTETDVTTQVYRVYIKAAPEAIWDAITDPEWTDRYGYGGIPEYDDGLRAGSAYRILAGAGMQTQGISGPIIDGEIIEADPPRKLVQSWRMLMDADLEAEGFTRITYEIDEGTGGVARLTVTHDVADAPRIASMIAGGLESTGGGGGWSWILSDLKTLLETGRGFQG